MDYSACGIVDKSGKIYSLGTDTKVISTHFENISAPVIKRAAKFFNLEVIEAPVQNIYPDNTLLNSLDDMHKIALDIKTTYRKPNGTFSYCLGSYTSYIRDGISGIVYPFNQYTEHWVIGFVYDRFSPKKSVYKIDDLPNIPVPFGNVEVFIQEKWRIASKHAGSGNTKNIGSIIGRIENFNQGKGDFHSEDEFLEYWRNY